MESTSVPPSHRASRLGRTSLLAAACLVASCGDTVSNPPPPPPGLTFTPAVATPPANSVSLARSGSSNSVLALDVVATQVQNVASVFFDLVFNPAIFQFDSATLGGFLGTSGGNASLTVPTDPAILAAANAAGRIPVSVNLLPATVGASGSGVLCTLTLRVVGSGTSPVSLEAYGARTPFPVTPIAIAFYAGSATVRT